MLGMERSRCLVNGGPFHGDFWGISWDRAVRSDVRQRPGSVMRLSRFAVGALLDVARRRALAVVGLWQSVCCRARGKCCNAAHNRKPKLGGGMRSRLVVLSTCALLASCSVNRLIYNQADWLVLDRIDRYLALEHEQRRALAQALAHGLARHRQQELPDYARVLRQAAAHVRDHVGEKEARWFVASAEGLITRTVDRLLPMIADALATLDASQHEHLAEQFAERNQSYIRKRGLRMSAADRLRRRSERAIDRVQDFAGELRPEQVALLTRYTDTVPDSSHVWLRYVQARQQQLLQLLSSGGNAEEITELLRRWWLQSESMPKALREARRRAKEVAIELLQRLHASMDDRQRDRLAARLEALADDAHALHLRQS